MTLLSLVRRLARAIRRGLSGDYERRQLLDHIDRFERETEGKLAALRRRVESYEDHNKEA